MPKQNCIFLFFKLKFSLADYGEVGGVGGTVVLKQDHAGKHHVYEDQPTAAESWSLVLSLEREFVENYTFYFNRWRDLSYLLSHSTQENQEIPPVVPVFCLGEVEIFQCEMDDVEKPGHHQNKTTACQPGIVRKSLKKCEKSSEISTRELDEQFVLCHPEDGREVRHLCSVSVGEEARDSHLDLPSLNHSDLSKPSSTYHLIRLDEVTPSTLFSVIK